MGRTVEASLGYGFVVEEGWKPEKVSDDIRNSSDSAYEIVDRWNDNSGGPKLECGFSGSLYGYSGQRVIVVEESAHNVEWGAKIVELKPPTAEWIDGLWRFTHMYYPHIELIEMGWVLWALEG